MAERVQIQLLGTSFSIQTDENAEYLRSLLDYMEKKIAELQRTVPTKDPLRIAIVACLLLTDELFKARGSTAEDDTPEARETARIASRLIEQLDNTLRES